MPTRRRHPRRNVDRNPKQAAKHCLTSARICCTPAWVGFMTPAMRRTDLLDSFPSCTPGAQGPLKDLAPRRMRPDRRSIVFRNADAVAHVQRKSVLPWFAGTPTEPQRPLPCRTTYSSRARRCARSVTGGRSSAGLRGRVHASVMGVVRRQSESRGERDEGRASDTNIHVIASEATRSRALFGRPYLRSGLLRFAPKKALYSF